MLIKQARLILQSGTTRIFENAGKQKYQLIISTPWQFKTIKLVQRPIKSLYL